MSVIREKLIYAIIDKLYNQNIHDNHHERYEFRKQTVLANKSLTEDEKTEAIKILNKTYDRNKINYNEGTKRICENCNQECLATSYCELCVRNYLIENFKNWTSGNNNIDNLIQKCQMKTIEQQAIADW